MRIRLFYFYIILMTFFAISCKSIINKIKEYEKRNIDRKHLNNNVEFEDFKAKKPYKEGILGCIAIRYNITNQSPIYHDGLYYFKWNVNLILRKSMSYMKNKEDTSTYIHEVVHYKLYNLAAEKIKKKLNSNGFLHRNNVNYRILIQPLLIENNYINNQFDVGDTLINGISINRLRLEILNELNEK